MVVALSLGNQVFFCTFDSSSSSSSSATKSSALGNLKPNNVSLHSQLLHRPNNTTSELSTSNQPNLTVTYLVNSCGLSPQDAVSASTKLKLLNPTRADSVLSLLRNYGFSETQISKLVRSQPHVLSADPEKTLAPKIEFFINVGLSKEDLAKVVTFNPLLLFSSLENKIVPSYNFLRELISEEQVVTVLKHKSWMFLDNLSKNVVPNIKLLGEVGVPGTRISMMVAQYSHLLMHNHEDFAQLLNEVKEMGFNPKKSTFVEAVRALCGESCKARYNRNREIYKKSWGWSDEDIASAFRRNPQCMIVSEKKIRKTMNFLVNRMGMSATAIPAYPIVLCLSLERRVIPRCCVVKALMSKGLVDENMSLAYVVLPEKQFLERFVNRYLKEVPELMSVYEGELDWKEI